MMPEKDIEKACLELLNKAGFFAWKLFDNTRSEGGRHRGAQPFQVKGQSDAIAIKDGRIWFIEFKTIVGKQSRFQKVFQGKIEGQGGCYILIRTIDECRAFIVSQPLKIGA